MIELHDVAAVRSAEQAHADALHTGALMERAATGLARAILESLIELRGLAYGGRVVIAIGSGNNGGDALFAGAQLVGRGVRVDAIGATDTVHPAGCRALLAAGGSFRTWDAERDANLLMEAEIVVDGLVGIGASGALRGPIAALAEALNATDAMRIAVDLPSGIDADTGAVDGTAVDADLTVTFGAVKPGLLLAPGSACTGAIVVVDIGIDDALGEPVAAVLQGVDVAGVVPEPAFDDHKYRRGVVGVSAGSPRYPGAALLCTAAALQGDIGMVCYLDRADGLAPQVVRQHPEVVAVASMDDARVTAWACGPGYIGDDHAAIDAVLRTAVPVVLDAGALSALASDESLRRLIGTRGAATVLTPHEGEFTRLGGDLGRGRLHAARELSERLDAVIVLKGPGSVIAAPDGTAFVDVAGTSALARAGSGDLLTGLAGALLAGCVARGEVHDVADVAHVVASACWIHGTAGRLASVGGVPVSTGAIAGQLGAAIAVARRVPGE